MNPLEAAIRSACRLIGADPETWRGFEEIGIASLAGLLSVLPEDPVEAIRVLREVAGG